MALKIKFVSTVELKKSTLCLGVFEGRELCSTTQIWDKKFNGALKQAIENSKFHGKVGQTFSMSSWTKENLKQIVFVGLGKKEKPSETQLQEIGGSITSTLEAGIGKEALIDIKGFKNTDENKAIAHLAAGAQLRSWHFHKYFTKKKPEELPQLETLTFCAPDPTQADKIFKPLEKVNEGVFLARELISEPANVIYPESYVQIIKKLSKEGLKVEILDEKAIKKLGMGALLGVAQGSEKKPYIAILHWAGGSKKEKPLAFVGKGITFDTGGISLKPPSGMEEMKFDMAGSAVVIGLMKALAGRKAKVNAVGVVALAENMLSGSAQRPGDVVKSMSGQTIEVINTDAEGRLVLADALWYTQDRFHPQIMVNLATLTGAIIISLGSERAGLFSNDDNLGKKLFDAGENIGEKLWNMPMDEAYDKDINCDIADMHNVGRGRNASSVAAAKLLQRFTNNVPWAHLDIAGVTWAEKNTATCTKGATAFGVRLLDHFVSKNYENK